MGAFTVKLNSAVSGFALLMLLAACAEKELILTGERFDVRTPLDASVPVEGKPAPTDVNSQQINQARPITLPPAQANADWTHRAGNVRHMSPHGALSVQPSLIWSVDIGAGNSRKNRISAAPIVAGGRVFTLDATARITATATTGAPLWSADLTPQTDRRNDVSGGGLAYGAGRIFATTGYGELLALDPASGAVVWRQSFDAPVTGAPTVDGAIVYVVARDGSAWALDVDTGRVRWQLQGSPSVTGMIGAAGPAVSERAVLLPFGSGELVAALKKGGTRLWGLAVAGERPGRAYGSIADITSDPVVDGSVVYVGKAGGRTVAVKASSGERIWTATEGAYGPLLPVGGSVFLVNDEARLLRLDAKTGDVIWSVEMPYFLAKKPKKRAAIHVHYGPVLAGGRLVVASSDGLIRLFNPVDGALLGTVDLPGGAAAQPALAGGTLYVVSGKGKLLAFR